MSALYLCLNCRTTQVAKGKPKNCVKCSAGVAWLRSEAELPGFAGCDEARAAEMAKHQGEELTKAMREPLRDVSAMAGKIERDSPLFFGTGDQPALF